MTGVPVRFELTSADATTAVALVFYDLGGNLVALDTAAEEVFYLTELTWALGNTALSLFDDANDDGVVDAGELVWRMASGDTDMMQFGMGHAPMKNPKWIASASSTVSVNGLGIIRGK